jgi:tetratricopeptide (TPR) repeat protein/ADP-heptose:LPS heptosyltransferase
MNRRERRANRGAAQSPAGLCEEAAAHLRAGRLLDAQMRCEQALAADPAHADSLHLMGLLSLQSQQYDHAVEWISRAIQQNPKPGYLVSLGTTLRRQGRHDEALQVYDKAIQIKPDDGQLWKKLGEALIDLERRPDALLAFQHVLKLDPHDWHAAALCGILLNETGRPEEALGCLDAYLALGHPLQAHQALVSETRAIALHRLNRIEEAAAENRRLLALDPENAEACNNLAAALQLLGKDAEASEWLERAIKLRPDYFDALINTAASLQQLHRFDEAAAVYGRLKAIAPDAAEPGLNLALLQLLRGDFASGWAGREVRWKLPSAYPKLDKPMWTGDADIAGKTILIGPDEGLGDTIQMARYVPMLATRGARVVLVVQDPLHPIFSDLPGVAQCLPTGSKGLPPFDLHCPVMSLPLAFGTRLDTIPPLPPLWPRPALARVQVWRDRLDHRLGHDARPRIGLVWSGSSGHKNDHNRSMPLRTLCRILDVDAAFVSLQKDPTPTDQAILRERTDIVDLTSDLTDFGQTLALLSCLDLVITVDTSVAHLAASLGLPTWIVLPYLPDFRWLLDHDDSPWYPTVRLFRQSKTRDYGEVLDRVRNELVAMRKYRTGDRPALS